MIMDITMLGIAPVFVVFGVGTLINAIMALVNMKLLGTGKAKEVKERMQSVRSDMLEAQKKGDTKQMNVHLSELMKINSEYMKFSLKPMIISLFLVLLILPVLRGSYEGKIVATIPGMLPLVGGIQLSWYWWYFISTLIVGIILKKITGI
jgi:uncharacterized membrane protein (DUF106 family)